MEREMKDSTKLWIGEIPSHWELKRIKNIIQPSKDGIKIGPFGSALTNKTIGEGEYNVYSQANLIASDFSSTKNTIDSGTFEELKNYEVFPDDICLSMMGTIGKCKKVPAGIRQGIMDSHLIKIRLAESVDSRFFEYVYDKDFGGVCFAQMQYDKKGFIMDGLNTSIVKNLYFPLPPLDEQIRISDFLDDECARIDAVIEKTRASIEEYKNLKQTVITQAVTKGIRPGREMKDSGVEWICDVPKAWTILSLKYLCSMQAGKNLVSEQISESGEFPVYGGNGLRGYFDSYNCEGKYLLVGRQGALCGNVHRVEGQFWATEHAVITMNSDLCDMDYLYYLLIGMNLNQYVSSTAAQPGLAVSTIQNVRTCLPPLDEQKEIASYLDNKIDEIQMLTEKKESFLMELINYKKSLIFEYVTGKKEVPR